MNSIIIVQIQFNPNRKMQIFAFDSNDDRVSAHSASRQQNYRCIECGGVVRLRGGAHKQLHFFHLDPPTSCRLGGKSLLHLQIQLYLQTLFTPEECQLERRFEPIDRIGDVVWEKEKLVFEIQCSSITQLEIQKRNSDYRSLGYRVVWILHDSQFNRRHLSSAEEYLRHHPHYYTNIDTSQQGIVYDQYSVDRQAIRRARSAPMAVHLKHPSRSIDPILFDAPVLRLRKKHWKLSFSGDLLDQASSPQLQQIIHSLDSRFPRPPRRTFKEMLYLPYRILFRALLEKSCD